MSVLASTVIVSTSTGWVVTALWALRLRRQTLTDRLTGVGNRKALTRAHRWRWGPNGLLMLDLDQFKPINDTWGHAVGDELIRVVAARLRSIARHGEMAVRLHGDEFVLWLGKLPRGVEGRRYAESRAADVRSALSEPAHIDGLVLAVSVSVGAATCDHRTPLPGLLADADKAMYEAKNASQTPTIGPRGNISPDRRSHGRDLHVATKGPRRQNQDGRNDTVRVGVS